MADNGVTSTVVGKVLDSVFGVIKTEIGYMWNCTLNVQNLKNEVEKLKVMKRQVQQNIKIAIDKGDNLKEGVEEWLNKADEEISKAEVFLEQEANAKKTCFKIGMCGNWATLHRYGKKTATKMTPSLLEHKASGTPYETCVSVYTRAPGPLDVYQNKDLDDIVTQNSALNDIIKALEDDNIQIIGIYGLGGVGKTTLAKEIVAKVKNTLFADVAFTTVSQTVKVEEIKKDIGEATKRIMKGDKILIILDDVWKKLDLEELCIPCGSKHKSCKILLTSRSKDVCEKMNAQSKICVNSLPTKEAWILFKRVVGERLETDADLKPVAEEVAKECGGLPLLIQVVGSTLKNKSISSWNSALSRLKKAAPSEIDPDIREAFTRLKLSYDYLESEEAKSCFLLCSMFPEDHDISLEDLVNYGVGLEKFDELDSIEDARGRVQNAVNILTSSALLLNSIYEGRTKMHDVVRDVALLIASQGNNKFLVKAGQGLTEWLPRDTSLERYTGISLMYNRIIKLPDYKVNAPHLEILFVNRNDDLSMISDEFIGCMKEVKVLDISGNKISSLPQSFQLLTKLRTLDLRQNKSLHEIWTLGKLKDLEILIINETGITEIPKEIGGLVNLRVLQVIGCEDLSSIAPGVISNLLRLEELRIDFKLKFKGASECIVEVMSLSKLAYLDLAVPSIDDIPSQGQGFNSEKLKGFVIQIGEYNGRISHISSFSRRYLVLSRVHLVIPLVKWLKKLIEGSRPITVLTEIKNLSNIMPTLYHQGFNKLEHIQLSWCPNVSCLVDDCSDWDEGKPKEKFFTELKHLQLGRLDELEVIWKCPDEYVSLTNLVTLGIWQCKKLERVLTVSVAQGLVNLKELTIAWCDGLEEVIWGGGGGDDDDRGTSESEEIVAEQQQHDSSSSSYSAANNNNTTQSIIIVFPSLAKIYVCNLRCLKSFFNSAGGGGNGNGNCSIKYPSLVDVAIDDCVSMKTWGPGIHETPNLKTLYLNGRRVPILLDGPSPINVAVEKYWRDSH